MKPPKPKNKEDKNPNVQQCISLLEKANLHNHPAFLPYIIAAMTSGRVADLYHLIKNNMPTIQSAIAWEQQNALRFQTDPFYSPLLPATFPGSIFIGHIVSLADNALVQELNASLKSINDHGFVPGSSGRGKTRGEVSMIRSIRSAHPEVVVWIFDQKQSLRHFFHPDFITLKLSDFRGQGLRPPTKQCADHIWRNKYIDAFSSGQYVKTATKYTLLQTIKKAIKSNRTLYPTPQMILATLEKEKKWAKSFRELDPIVSLINRYSAIVEAESYTEPYHIPVEVLINTNLIFECGDEISEIEGSRIFETLNSLLFYKKFNRNKDLPFNLIVFDEGRTIFGEQSFNEGDSVLESMFALAREERCGFMVCTQEPSSVSKVVKANIDTLIAYDLSDGHERKNIAVSSGLTPQQYEIYKNIRSYDKRLVVFKSGDTGIPVLVMMPFVDNPHYIPESEITARKIEFLDPFKIEPPASPSRQEPAQLPKDHMLMLKTLIDNPYCNSTELYKLCGFPPDYGTEIRNNLKNGGYLDTHSIRVNKGGRIPMFTELTDKSYRLLKVMSDRYGREGYIHATIKHLIDLRLTNRGWRVALEAPIKGRPGQRYDLLAEKDGNHHAYEVTIHLKNLKDNITAAFSDDRIETLFIVAKDKTAKDKCIKNSATTDPRVKFITISEVEKNNRKK